MGKISTAHIEQAKILRAEGKSIREIVEILEETYKIKTYAGAVTKACKGVKSDKLAKHASGKHKPQGGVEDAASPDQAIKDIVTLLAEIQNGYKQVFSYLRKELIKSRAQVNTMLQGAGLSKIESTIQ